MLACVRVGDTTYGYYNHKKKCCKHKGPGTNIQGAKTVFVENRPIVRFSDKTIHTCPHCKTGICIGKNPTVFSEYLPHHDITNSINEICGKGRQRTGSNSVFDGN